MTQVEFHSGVGDTVRYACRLLRKAWRQGIAVLVTAPPPTLQALDRELWTFEAQAFIPHQHIRPGQELDAALCRTPIWLCAGEAPAPCPKVLLNLGAGMQGDPQRYERIIELVSEGTEERQLARARWRAYEALGMGITHHARTEVS
jgi:DNA polymerase-3 subunit chi